jgi:cytochrome c5
MNTRFRFPLTFLLASFGVVSTGAAQTAQYLDQNWSGADSHYFYRTTQGSRLIPYQMFVKLEESGSTARFASPAHMMALGYLIEAKPSPAPAGWVDDNPDNLPIGFVKDVRNGKADAVGLTCAACHTRDITYQGTRMRIDGAPGYGDTERFLRELEAALLAPLNDTLKFERLRVAMGVSNATTLRTDLTAAYNKLALENESNRVRGTTQVNAPGPGRLDAFAHIKNRVSNVVLAGNSTQTANTVDATAPVNFPFLWNAPYQDYVQWPGNVPNWGPGSLARNVGEVLGVFAETTASRDLLGLVQASSTAHVPNLVEIENRLLRLRSPAWPSQFPAPNAALAAIGEPLFAQYCGSCHGKLDRLEPFKFVRTSILGANVVGTDPTMADNNLNDRALAGVTNANPNTVVNPLDTLGAVETPLLLPELWRGVEMNATHKQPASQPARNLTLAAGESSLHTYKARPLNGIWATAPYLHNGSVRTLYQLMQSGPSRDAYFCVSSTEFSPADVGLANDCANGGYFFDTTKKGNSRLGHEYGTPADTRFPILTDYQRRAVVEYMKTL